MDAYDKYTWGTTDYVTPTKMNHMEDGIANASTNEIQSQLGAKNLNSYPYYRDNGRVSAGVTYTVNADGSVEPNGTATGGDSSFGCHSREYPSRNMLILPNGTYILTGCPSGGSSSKYYITASIYRNGDSEQLARDTGSGAEFTVNGDDNFTDKAVIHLLVNIKEGQNANGKIFKPMIRLKGDNDAVYKPYAMTNEQITEVIGNPPRNSGTYTLQLVVDSNGNRTYSWV